MGLVVTLVTLFIIFQLITKIRAHFSPRMVSKEIVTTVQAAIKNNSVFIASKSYCPYCQATLKTFDQLGVKPYVLQLNQMDEGADIQAYLRELTGQSTVPNIFINGEHIGGNSDLQALKSTDKLKSLLKL
jgi:glutaredoxin 3